MVCYAENGYGPGSEKTIPINVMFSPTIRTELNVVRVSIANFELSFRVIPCLAMIQKENFRRPCIKRSLTLLFQIDTSISEVELVCIATGNPQPVMMWYKNIEQEVVVTDEHHDVTVVTNYNNNEYPSYEMHLKIFHVNSEDLGDYHCNAENQHGQGTATVKVVQDKLSWGTQLNVTECCKEMNVSSECIDACVFDIDIQRALSKPVCVPELEKMMHCASGRPFLNNI